MIPIKRGEDRKDESADKQVISEIKTKLANQKVKDDTPDINWMSLAWNYKEPATKNLAKNFFANFLGKYKVDFLKQHVVTFRAKSFISFNYGLTFWARGI